MAVTQYGFHEQLVNRYEGTLNGAITAGATTLTLTDATGLPTTGYFRLKINSEIILCIHRSGNVVTAAERGAEGTTAAAHSDLDAVECVLTNKGFQEYLLRNGHRCGAYTQQSSFADSQRWPIPHRMTWKDNTTLTASSFTWHNQGSATMTDSGGGGVIMTIPDETNHKLRGVTVTAGMPTAPYAMTAKMRIVVAPGDPLGINSTHAGLWIRDASNRLLTLSCRMGQGMAMWEWTDWNTFSATVDQTLDFHEQPHIWIRIVDDNTNHLGFFSQDGINWTQSGSAWWQQSRTAHLTSGGNGVGFYLNSGTDSGNTAAGPAEAMLAIEAFHVEEY